VPSRTFARQAPPKRPGNSKKVSLFKEAEQRNVIKFLVEEGMNGVEIIGRLNKHYGGDALQRTQVCYLIKEVKSGRKDLSDVPPPGRAPDDGFYDPIENAFKEDPHLSTRKIAKAMNASSMTPRGNLIKSLGMKCDHM
jgi:hypothetical protein